MNACSPDPHILTLMKYIVQILYIVYTSFVCTVIMMMFGYNKQTVKRTFQPAVPCPQMETVLQCIFVRVYPLSNIRDAGKIKKQDRYTDRGTVPHVFRLLLRQVPEPGGKNCGGTARGLMMMNRRETVRRNQRLDCFREG